MRVGLIDDCLSPFVGRMAKSCLDAGADINAIILYQKGRSGDNLRRFVERTRWRLPPVSVDHFQRPILTLADRHRLVTLVQENQLDCLINSGVNFLFGSAEINALCRGIVGLHPGELPYFRGASCVEWAIFHDRPVVVSAHFLTKELDGGRAFLKQVVDIRRGMDLVDIRVKVYEARFALAALVVRSLREHSFQISEYQTSDPGHVFAPIGTSELEEVERKLANHEYSHYAN